jgi:hypothetical protein
MSDTAGRLNTVGLGTKGGPNSPLAGVVILPARAMKLELNCVG